MRSAFFPADRLLIVALVLVAARSAFATEASQFTDANRAYESKRYEDATAKYEALVHDRQWSAPLFYDLGNTWFRRGDVGRAILNYERALALDPHQPETLANLQFVREGARALQMPLTRTEHSLAFAQSSAFAVSAAAAFWCAAIFALVGVFSQKRRRRLLAVSVLALLLCVGCAFACYSAENGNHGRAFAIVTGKDVEARVASADTASGVLLLPQGSEVRVLSPRGDWTYVALPNESRGWIPSNSFELVRL